MPISKYAALLDLISDPGDDCISIEGVHSLTNSGYGQVRVPHEKRVRSSHAAALASVTPMPSPGMYAAHGPCHNRLCVNPNHLSWKTPSENAQDKVRDDTHQRGARCNLAKLTEIEAAYIKVLPMTQAKIGKLFGISQTQVGRIKTGKRWSHLHEKVGI